MRQTNSQIWLGAATLGLKLKQLNRFRCAITPSLPPLGPDHQGNRLLTVRTIRQCLVSQATYGIWPVNFKHYPDILNTVVPPLQLKYQNLRMLKSYKMEERQPSTLTDSQPQIKNTVFHSRLVESVDMKPKDMEGRLCIYWKKICVSGSTQVKPMLFKG